MDIYEVSGYCGLFLVNGGLTDLWEHKTLVNFFEPDCKVDDMVRVKIAEEAARFKPNPITRDLLLFTPKDMRQVSTTEHFNIIIKTEKEQSLTIMEACKLSLKYPTLEIYSSEEYSTWNSFTRRFTSCLPVYKNGEWVGSREASDRYSKQGNDINLDFRVVIAV